jgi:hypothetical protein
VSERLERLRASVEATATIVGDFPDETRISIYGGGANLNLVRNCQQTASNGIAGRLGTLCTSSETCSAHSRRLLIQDCRRDYIEIRIENQLGQSHLVYRGATHKRLEHSLGTAYTA